MEYVYDMLKGLAVLLAAGMGWVMKRLHTKVDKLESELDAHRRETTREIDNLRRETKDDVRHLSDKTDVGFNRMDGKLDNIIKILLEKP